MKLCFDIKDINKKFVIYKLYNTVNGKCYIGQTNDIKRRLRRHKKDSELYNTYLYRSIRKYGLDAFSVYILDICDSKEELDDMEYHFIRQYNSRQNQNGYNCTDGGEGTSGYIITDEHKENLSKSLKGREFTDEWKDKISKTKKENYVKENHPNFGKHLSDECKICISKGNKGKVRSNEFKENLSYYNNHIKKRDLYSIIEPNGNVVISSHVVDYCKDNDLVYSVMMKVQRGERTHHKQYRINKI